MAQDKNSNSQDQRSFLARLIAGGATGRGSPYANEASGPFAASPRFPGGGGNPLAAALPAAAAGVPAPIPRPGEGSNFRTPVPILRPDPNQPPSMASTATSPSSLIQTPPGPFADATSPSSLLQSPDDAAAAPAPTAQKNPIVIKKPATVVKKPPAAAPAAPAATAAPAPFSWLHPSTW
jgi:hypothetical protein